MTISVRQLKPGYYLLTALGTLATSYFSGYLFFLLRDRFGFGNRENLTVAAFHGAIYIVSAWQCGKFAERRGFHLSLKLGFGGLFLCMVAGALVTTAAAEIVVIAVYSVVLLFIWPALEALTTEHEPPARVPHAIGLYNCMWSSAAAFAYFTGGSLYGWLGAGAVFWIPAAIFLVALMIVFWLARLAAGAALPDPASLLAVAHHPDAALAAPPVDPRTFLKLAWLANPFSFVALFTLIAVMPGLAVKLGLTPAQVGLFCSVWLFGRFGSFIWLWHWTGWHYRFRWLAGGYLLLTGTFAAILLAPALWMVIVAQVGFGIACGILYYSSLFYSMDVGAARAELGGLHEAALGAGIFAGPAVGAAALYLFPQYDDAGALAVSGLLAAGFVALIAIWMQARLRFTRSRASRVGRAV